MKNIITTCRQHIMSKVNWQFLFFFFLFVHIYSCQQPSPAKNIDQRIIVEATISKHFYGSLREIYTIKDEINLTYFEFPNTSPIIARQSISGKVANGKVTWILYSVTPVKVMPPVGTSIIMNPGDSVHISYLYDYPIYSGKNMQTLELLTALMKADEKLIKPRKKNSYNARTLEDFMEWNQYLDNKLAVQAPILEYYKDKIPASDYQEYAANTIGSIEGDRLDAFQAFRDSVQRGYPGLSLSNLQDIWDSTQYKPKGQWLRSLSTYYGSINNIYSFNKLELFRHFGFDPSNDSLASKEIRTYLYYTRAKQQYKGLMRERLLAYILDEPTITEMSLKNPTAQAMLKDYYSQPGYPEFKEWVRELEMKKLELEKEHGKKKKEKQDG